MIEKSTGFVSLAFDVLDLTKFSIKRNSIIVFINFLQFFEKSFPLSQSSRIAPLKECIVFFVCSRSRYFVRDGPMTNLLEKPGIRFGLLEFNSLSQQLVPSEKIVFCHGYGSKNVTLSLYSFQVF